MNTYEMALAAARQWATHRFTKAELPRELVKDDVVLLGLVALRYQYGWEGFIKDRPALPREGELWLAFATEHRLEFANQMFPPKFGLDNLPAIGASR